MSKASEKQRERSEAIEKLKGWINPGDTISTILTHCSKSGMSRSIKLVICHEGEPFDVSYWAGLAMDNRIDRNNGGIKIGGCGMDMGFALVYNLGRTLFPDGFKLAKGQRGRNGDKSGFDTDGGYALNQRWL